MLSTQINGDVLKPQFLDQLRYLRERCDTQAERERCDRLAASLLFTSQINCGPTGEEQRPKQLRWRRPQTAMASLECDPCWEPYETTVAREYTPKTCELVNGLRPRSSKGYRYPYKLGDPIGCTHYSEEFQWKPFCKPDPIRAATSSGVRNNRPIPSKGFMTWRLPREEKHISVDSRSPWSKPPSLEEAEKMIKEQYSSTYRRDYLGIPQGFQVKHAFSSLADWKKEIPHTLNTEFRYHYQIPLHIPNLAELDLKYGAYANLHCPAQGAVPTVIKAHIKNQENRIQRTTYQRHFGKTYLDLQLVLHSLDPEEVKGYLRKVPKDERKAIQQFLKTVARKEGKSEASKTKECDLPPQSLPPACPPQSSV
ncbi:hypothetical protein NDU88_002333 [Pleurodeles waltl]|uniref:Testis-expressed protein 26 n=1 Tax=Pleurodeles waltl TaxID=8319 RepID=A0AAV7NHD4_PLEWA|nr:hypothetical protein NDU88_002333 [Pleurodeles waltl]